jgi:biopolymer transport protein ExbD
MNTPDRRGRRRLDGDLNLVPYIDLLTCMIAFLLITAVWTQLARLTVQHPGTGDPTDQPPQTKVTVLVDGGGFNLLVDQDRHILPRRSSGYDFAGLLTALQKLKSALPDKEDVLVASEDGITFDTLIATMDTALSAGFPAVSLSESDQRRRGP